MSLNDEAHREMEDARNRSLAAAGKLGRFGHHPDPGIDFEVECDALLGLAYDAEHGMVDKAQVIDRMAKALEFRVGGILSCINAKESLRERFNELNFN